MTTNQLTRFQSWALRFVAQHGRTDCDGGTIALADGRVRIASPATHRDSTGHVSDICCIAYASDDAEVRAILGY